MTGIMVTGFPRSGTTLLYCMLRHSVSGYQFCATENRDVLEGQISKYPKAVFTLPGKHAHRAIVMIRDPRAILTSIHRGEGFAKHGYFVSAHSCVNDERGLCEWWEGIKRLKTALRVRYEDLVDDPDAIQSQIGERFGLTYRARFSDFHTSEHGRYWEDAMNGRRPVNARDWRSDPEHVARVTRQFSEFPELHAVMQEMGYELRE